MVQFVFYLDLEPILILQIPIFWRSSTKSFITFWEIAKVFLEKFVLVSAEIA